MIKMIFSKKTINGFSFSAMDFCRIAVDKIPLLIIDFDCVSLQVYEFQPIYALSIHNKCFHFEYRTEALSDSLLWSIHQIYDKY